MRRLRLAILGTRGLPARYGGFETFAEELGVGLAAAGVEVTVYCEAADGERPSHYRGVRLVHVPAPRLGPLTTVLYDLRCLWHARRGHDVVYMLGYGAAVFCFLPRLWGARVWINMDGVEWARAKWGRVAKAWFLAMEALSTRTPTRLIADAEGIRAHLQARHRRLPPCSVIPYGAHLVEAPPDPAPVRDLGLEPGTYYLIVCRLEPENHVLELLQGFARLPGTATLAVLGDHGTGTPYVARLLAVEHPRIRLLGTIYDATRLQALRYHCRAYLHGHSVGGTNPSLLESLACGNPVLAHDNSFNREVAAAAAQYFSGAEDVAVSLAQLEADPEARQKMATAARERIRTAYTWPAIVRSYLELLEQEAGNLN